VLIFFCFFLYMASKTVTIKPEFLQSKRKTKRNNPNNQVVIQPTNLREMLLNKLVERRKSQKLKVDPPILNEVSFDRDPVHMPVPVTSPSQDKPYGILKNGNKPTFKAWTASERLDPPERLQTSLAPSLETSLDMIEAKPEPTPEPVSMNTNHSTSDPEPQDMKEKVIVGKNKKKKSVCILIENNKTRKLHGEKVQKIKKTSIQTVRNYLKNHNLIKSGSAAPNPLLRTLYENVLFCGDITNQNKENLIHNFSDKAWLQWTTAVRTGLIDGNPFMEGISFE